MMVKISADNFLKYYLLFSLNTELDISCIGYKKGLKCYVNWLGNILGPVVQNIISLMSSLLVV